jgi:hypothetical protein
VPGDRAAPQNLGLFGGPTQCLKWVRIDATDRRNSGHIFPLLPRTDHFRSLVRSVCECQYRPPGMKAVRNGNCVNRRGPLSSPSVWARRGPWDSERHRLPALRAPSEYDVVSVNQLDKHLVLTGRKTRLADCFLTGRQKTTEAREPPLATCWPPPLAHRWRRALAALLDPQRMCISSAPAAHCYPAGRRHRSPCRVRAG